MRRRICHVAIVLVLLSLISCDPSNEAVRQPPSRQPTRDTSSGSASASPAASPAELCKLAFEAPLRQLDSCSAADKATRTYRRLAERVAQDVQSCLGADAQPRPAHAKRCAEAFEKLGWRGAYHTLPRDIDACRDLFGKPAADERAVDKSPCGECPTNSYCSDQVDAPDLPYADARHPWRERVFRRYGVSRPGGSHGGAPKGGTAPLAATMDPTRRDRTRDVDADVETGLLTSHRDAVDASCTVKGKEADEVAQIEELLFHFKEQLSACAYEPGSLGGMWVRLYDSWTTKLAVDAAGKPARIATDSIKERAGGRNSVSRGNPRFHVHDGFKVCIEDALAAIPFPKTGRRLEIRCELAFREAPPRCEPHVARDASCISTKQCGRLTCRAGRCTDPGDAGALCRYHQDCASGLHCGPALPVKDGKLGIIPRYVCASPRPAGATCLFGAQCAGTCDNHRCVSFCGSGTPH